MIHRGDCIEVMAGMEPESVDAIVTDPPYGLEFMGKSWDSFKTTGNFAGGGKSDPVSFNAGSANPAKRGNNSPLTGRPRFDTSDRAAYIAWTQRWAEAAYRVAKPSAYLLAFGGTRTVHRMTVALEDAGWIIRDMLVWGYASGFPKSKASLKPAWEPIVMARKPGPLRELAIDLCRIAYESTPNPATNPAHRQSGGYQVRRGTDTAMFRNGGSAAGEDLPAHPSGRWPANIILTDPIFDGGIEGVVGGGRADSGSASGYDWGESGNDNPTHVTRNIKSGVHFGDSGTYSRFFLVPKSSRDDREPTINPYCTCETVKLRAWEVVGRKQPVQTGNTSRARAISEAITPDGFGSNTTLFGSSTSDPSDQDSKSTTSTVTSSTTGSRTSKPSIASPTSGSTPAASSSTASGGSDAPSAESSESSTSPTGTSPERDGPSTVAAVPATFARSSRPSVCAECGKEVMPSSGARINAHPT